MRLIYCLNSNAIYKKLRKKIGRNLITDRYKFTWPDLRTVINIYYAT